MGERVEVIAEQFERMRRYTLMVLEHTDRARWFEMPPGCPTHVGWEVGHITWAQAIHALKNVGRQATVEPVPEKWGELFGKGSVAVADAKAYPGMEEILRVFDATFARTMQVLRALREEELDEVTSHTTGLVRNKLDLLYFLMRHEAIHTGHIAVVRRMWGAGPYR